MILYQQEEKLTKKENIIKTKKANRVNRMHIQIPIRIKDENEKKNANKNSCSIIDRITNSIRIDRSIDGSYGNGWVGRKGGLFATMAAEPKEKGTLIKEALNSGFRARTTVE